MMSNEEDQTTAVATYDGIDIEELIGFVEEEYPCVYCGVNGTLYAGTDGLAFLGKFYLFNKKVYLKWVDVKVQQTDQGIAIQTRQLDEPLLHEFTGIHKPDRVWSILIKLHNQALLDRTMSPEGSGSGSGEGGDGLSTTTTTTPSNSSSTARTRAATAQPMHRRKQLRRMTSDPNKLAPDINELFAEANKEDLLLGWGGGDGATSTNSHMVQLASKDFATETTSLLLPPHAQQPADSSKSSTTRRSSVIINKDHQLSARASETLGVVDMEANPLAVVEAIVGKIQGQFVCLYNRQQGTLYAGSTAIYFAGDRLFFPARLTVQSSHIRQVKMVKGKPKSDGAGDGSGGGGDPQQAQVPQQQLTVEDMIREQGIEICTHEGETHMFLGMTSPDHVWASLVALRKHASTGPNSPRPFAMRRMNSDPNLESNTTGFDLMMSTDAGGEDSAPKELAPPVLTEEELSKAWSDVMAKKNRYKTCVLKDHEFGCSLDKFFKSYIANDAEFSIPKYMEAQGDKEMKVSPWKQSNKDGKLVRSRVIRYVHPINAPLAPPEAKARREQTYQRFGGYGIVVETKTFVKDVPLTDCFYVKDRLVIAFNKETGHVLLTMEFELNFVKSTMFRGVITKTTTSEMSKFFELMRDFMAKSVGEEVTTAKPKAADGEGVAEEPGFLPFLPGGLATASLTQLLLLFVIFIQFWLLLEMWSMKRAIRRVEAMEYRPVCFPEQQQVYGDEPL